MIDYETFHQIRHLHEQERLTAAQIARQLDLHPQTVAQWLARPRYQRRAQPRRPSKLEPFKSTVARLLAQHPFTAQQVFQRLREGGYAGGYTILADHVRQVRPAHGPAFLTLQFAPGQCAQVDWGSAGWLRVGATRRRLSFFVMVLCYSRRLFVEFTLAQTQEHFLAGHQHAFEYFGGVSAEVTHYRREVTLGEDACRAAHRQGAAVLASLRNLAIGVYELERERERTRVDTLKSWCQQQRFSTVWPILQR